MEESRDEPVESMRKIPAPPPTQAVSSAATAMAVDALCVPKTEVTLDPATYVEKIRPEPAALNRVAEASFVITSGPMPKE
jgi:hypothetical protein